ncbi:AI-2E family transporter [Arvimicrobium flavum]|uniref:AI-2E family transporter n=1 Tax=Arvimicrobium flavum TaxID=3393320 RepID=UPI00237BEB32|nr:AI-2E family transporter [Mesorhizobium shangrilense]
MSDRTAKKAPVVRLPLKSNAEVLLTRSAQVATVFLGIIGFVFALKAGEYILAPITLGIVVGLMLGPIAAALERRGVPCGLSALLVAVLFIAIVCAFAAVVAAPLSFWIDRLPQLWAQLQQQLSNLKGPLDALGGIRDELREVTGSAGLKVTVDEGVPVESFATLAPALLGQILLFFASLYFFVATRHETRAAILSLCFSRRLRWRVAHIFRDVESMVSRYLLSIALINLAEGASLALGLWLIGVPSAILWGAVAAIANFIVFIGPAFVTVLLFVIGLTQFDTVGGSLLPAAIYLVINTIEGQFVTPLVIGRTMTMNPFIVLLGLAFWIWAWGALGGFIAIPALLILYAVVRNILPGVDWLSLPAHRTIRARITGFRSVDDGSRRARSSAR